jgi:hypothetical protein
MQHSRKALDCRNFPGSNCTLRIEGSEDEVLRAGMQHAVSSHGHTESGELRGQLKSMLITV